MLQLYENCIYNINNISENFEGNVFENLKGVMTRYVLKRLGYMFCRYLSLLRLHFFLMKMMGHHLMMQN